MSTEHCLKDQTADMMKEIADAEDHPVLLEDDRQRALEGDQEVLVENQEVHVDVHLVVLEETQQALREDQAVQSVDL